MVRKTDQSVIREHAHGGPGHIEVCQILAPQELRGRASLYAKVVVPPGAGIGLHPHYGETESYYILSGNGFFLDGSGQSVPVGPGDICDIREGESHGIENSGTAAMEMIALVLPM